MKSIGRCMAVFFLAALPCRPNAMADNGAAPPPNPSEVPAREPIGEAVPSLEERMAADRRTREYLDASAVVEDPDAATAPAAPPPRSDDGPSAWTWYLLAAALAAAAFAWRKTIGPAHPAPSRLPATRRPPPRLGIVLPELNDYPVTPNTRFTDAIVQRGLVTREECDGLLTRFNSDAFRILLHLAEGSGTPRSTLGQLWGDSLDVAYVDPFKSEIQHEKRRLFTDEFLDRHPVLPLYELDGVLTVATYNPKDAALTKEMENLTGKFISPVFAFPDQITACLAIGRATASALADRLASLPSAAALGAPVTDADEDSSTQVIADFARDMLLLAMQKRASDIHIEPHEDFALVRFRIDGVLQEIMKLNLPRLPNLTNVLKIRAGVDIAEKRRPQDGHMTFDLAGQALDIRFSSVPIIYGEKLVLRLLGQNQFTSIPRIEDLGCSSRILRGMERIIQSPNGVFFVTGPTGSGKTTTLYAALKTINQSGLNIMTVEDPVEYHLPGLNQVQVNPVTGLTFATVLRSFLRQDPDVILVGEVRDLETAKVAAQAALTGHLVLTTMHTNNALQAITRLIQIGVEPFLVAPSIIGVMGQRLVRKLCTACRVKVDMTPDEIRAIFDWDGTTPVSAYRAKGCRECDYTGYSGRTAIHELFVIDDETRDLIAHGATILDIKRQANSRGFTTMRYDGIKKVLRGITTFEEVDDATTEE